MTGVDLLITIALFGIAGGLAGIACAIGEARLRRKAVDWRSEDNARGVR